MKNKYTYLAILGVGIAFYFYYQQRKENQALEQRVDDLVNKFGTIKP